MLTSGGSAFREELADLSVDKSPLTVDRKIGRYIALRALKFAESPSDTPHRSAVHAAAAGASLETPSAHGGEVEAVLSAVSERDLAFFLKRVLSGYGQFGLEVRFVTTSRSRYLLSDASRANYCRDRAARSTADSVKYALFDRRNLALEL